MTDLATLGIEIDSRQVPKAIGELDKLADAGARAEASVGKMGGTAKGASAAAAEYAASAQRMAAASVATGSGMASLGRATSLASYQVTNITAQFSDLATGIAAGQNPFRVFILQIGQIAGIMQRSGLGVAGFAKELAILAGLLNVTRDAELGEAAANAAASASAIKGAAERAAAAILAADTELALAEAEKTVARGSVATAAAQTRLVAAHEGVAAAAAEATIADAALARANVAVAETATAAAAAESVALGPLAIILGGVAAAAAIAYGAFKLFQSEVDKSGELTRYAQGLGLTKKEMEKLKDVSVTMGDVFSGIWKTIADHSGVDESLRDFKSFAIDQFEKLLQAGVDVFAELYGAIVGTYRASIVIWQNFPAALGDLFYSGVNAAIDAINKLLKASIGGVNGFIDTVNGILGTSIGHIADVQIANVANQYAGAASKVANAFGVETAKATAEARKNANAIIAEVKKNILDATKDRLKGQADEIIGDRNPRKGRTAKAKKEELSETEKAYRAALKAAQDYQNALGAETDRIGKNTIEIKRMDVAQAAAAARKAAAVAPTKAQADALLAEAAGIMKAGAAWEMAYKNDQAAQFIKNRVEPLELEAAMIGKSIEQQARMRAERELTKAGFEKGTEAWNRYMAAVEVVAAKEQMLADQQKVIDHFGAMADAANASADAIKSAFGNAGDVFGSMIANVADYRAEQAALTKDVLAGNISRETADKRLATLQVKNTASALAGMKSLFKEHSTGYKVMTAVEKAYALFQMAQTIASMARDAMQTTSSLANSASRTTANTAEGGSKIFSQLGVYAFPVVAAMVAVLAALGAKGGGGGASSAPTSAEDLQAAAGTGSVLGDSKAKSESIANSLELVASNTNKDLEYSNQMLIALRSIDLSIAKMAGTVARQIQVAGSLFDTSKLNLGSSGSGGFLGIGKKTVTRSLYDLGLNLNSGSVADIIANGISGTTYQVVQRVKTKSGFLGLGGGTKTSYETTTGQIDGEITSAIQEVVKSLRDGLLSAADVIGLQGAEAILNSFNISLGKISFKDMTGQQIEDQLNAIFSKVGDDMAGAIFPALKAMQKVGEGLFETFIRVAREYEVVDVALKSIGRSFGAVGVSSVAARDALVQLFGGLDQFVEATSFFRDQFLSEAEQMAPIISSVRAEMTRLGLSGVTTREQFKNVVLGLDLTTTAGREMYAALLNVAPAFDKTLDYFEKVNKTTIDGLNKTIDQFAKFAESLRKYRDTLFATDTAQGNAYALLKARFLQTAGLAGQGDATALGGLETAGKSFLDAAKNNASTREQYLRDVAIVAQGVDKGIFAADTAVDYAKLQLDALNNAVSILGQISVASATTAAALAGQPVPAPVPAVTAGQQGTQQSGAPIPADLKDEITQLRADLNAALQAIAVNTGNTDRTLKRWDRGDTVGVSADADAPLNTQVLV